MASGEPFALAEAPKQNGAAPAGPETAASAAGLSVDTLLACGGLLSGGADGALHGDLEDELRQQIAGALADGIDPSAIAAVFAAAGGPGGAAGLQSAVLSVSGISAVTSKPFNYPDECCVHIGNLEGGEDEIWPEQLKQHFKACGEIWRITIKIDKVTGLRLGHGYIDFADEVGATTALSMDGSPFGARVLRVNRKRPNPYPDSFKGKGKKGKGGKGKGGGWYDSGWSGGGGGGGGYWGVTNSNWGKNRPTPY